METKVIQKLLVTYICDDGGSEEVNKENCNNTGETGTAGVVVVGCKQVDKEGKKLCKRNNV